MRILTMSLTTFIVIIGACFTQSFGRKTDPLILYPESVKEILDSVESLIDSEVAVKAFLCQRPEQMPTFLPLPLLSFDILNDSVCSKQFYTGSGPWIKIYPDTTLIKLESCTQLYEWSDSLFKNLRYKRVEVRGYLRKIVIDNRPLGGSLNIYYYIEFNSIDSISSSNKIKENSNPLKKNDNIEILDGKIVYLVDKPSYVSVEILNTKGILVKTLISVRHSSGWHKLYLDEIFSKDSGISKGSYFVRLSIDGESIIVKKLILTH